MAVTTKTLSQLDENQVQRSIYNDTSGAIAVEGWVTGKIGRKITITAFSATVDDVEFLEGATSLMVLRITYNNSAHDNTVSVERTA